jgi:hypothetical protein
MNNYSIDAVVYTMRLDEVIKEIINNSGEYTIGKLISSEKERESLWIRWMRDESNKEENFMQTKNLFKIRWMKEI